MDALLSRLLPAHVPLLALLLMAFLATMIVWLSLQWRLHRRTEIEAELKHAMLERGMSAEEIALVMRANARATSDTVGASIFGDARVRTLQESGQD